MKEKLMKLKQLRELEQKSKQDRDAAIEKLPAVIEFNLVKEQRESLEKEIRDEAIQKYNETGEKKFGQVGIRIMSKYNYDELVAFSWAKSHDLCLKLDTTAFNKLAKSQQFDFVEVEEVPTATLPTEIKEE